MLDLDLLQAAMDTLRWQNLLAVLIGVMLGQLAGAIPGITISLAMALLLPFTFGLETSVAISLLLGLYMGGMVGGSYSAILLNMPGTPSAAATMLDGYPMAQRGEAGKALGTAVISSFLGGLIGFAALVLFAPLIGRVALGFGQAELFALVFLGLSLIVTFSASSIIKGLISGVVGLMIMTIGLDPLTATPRFTFGILELQEGVPLLVALIGLFVIPQLIDSITARMKLTPPAVSTRFRDVLPGWGIVKRLPKGILIGGSLGVGIGAIPGAGGPIAVFLAYDANRRASKDQERFGTGAPEGVATCEAANSGMAGGAMIPLITLGIPGDPITAVLLGALLIQGLAPGPFLMVEQPQFVYGVFVTFFIAILMNLGFSLLGGIRLILQALRAPSNLLLPFIAAMALLGSYAIRNTLFDSFLMIAFGILAYFMRRYGFPVLPMLLALVLGPPLERHLRLSLTISGGDPLIFLTRPVSAVLIMLGVLALTSPLWGNVLARLRSK
ncbi:MAG: tripartite tricarboxylate transporter permease [Thermosphaera sp.]